MDDEAQKMVALKKAYAEIILNTGKEAAARIMVSESKTLRVQRDLVATKDEALRMLVRLKQMLDSKAAEAELTSLNQQRKIDELEAQLQEAEDVITDLRAELRTVEGELDKVKSNKVQPLNGLIVGEHGSFCVNSTSVLPSLSSSELITLTVSDVDNMPSNEVLDNKCCTARQAEQSSVSNLDLYPHNSDIASIIMKRKEPKLYRNGCTQRIRALERNLFDGKLSPAGSVDNENSLGNNESTVKVSNNNSLKNKKTEMVKNGFREEVKKPAKVRTLRKKKTRFGKVKSSARSHHSQLSKTRPVISHFKRNSVNGNYRLGDGEHIMPSVEDANMDMTETLKGEENLPHKKGHHKDEVMVTQKGKRQRKMRNGENTDYLFTCPPCQPAKPSQPSSVLSRCRTFEYLVNGGIKSGQDGANPIENETKFKSFSRLDPGVTVIKSDMDPISGSSSVTLSVKAINKLEQINDAADLMIEPESVKQETDVTENSTSPSSTLNLDMTKPPSMNSELKSEQLIQSPSHLDSNRLLKYTFQRKRKKEAANNSDEIASPDKNSTKKKTTDVAQVPQKSSFIDESSRDNRRLVQVARQLISLSGKRWQ